jgi:pimeloyl-ACP methyl ester carboxylesterase
MSVRPWRDIARRKSRQIMVGKVPVGGDAPIAVQSMTNTLTSDAKATIEQIRQCEEVGADIMRVSCPDVESTAALKTIVRGVKVPIVADIHFHYKRGIEAAEAGAACLRINPGNIGSADRVREVVQAAKDGPAATVEAALSRWFTDSFRLSHPQMMDEVRRWILANRKDVYAPIYQVLVDGVTELVAPNPPIAAPTLVMTGEEDYGNSPAMSRAIAAEIAGSELVILPGLRHMALAEAPELFNAKLLNFLSRVQGG